MNNDYEEELMKNQVAFDFDGVVHANTSEWQGVLVIPDGPVPGIKKLFQDLKSVGKRIVIYSCRAKSEAGRNVIIHWLIANGLWDYVSEVTAEKPIANCYIDDRAICFNGSVDGLFWQIMNFKSYQEK